MTFSIMTFCIITDKLKGTKLRHWTKNAGPSTLDPILHTPYPGPRALNPVTLTQYPETSTLDPVPRTQYPGPGTRNPDPGPFTQHSGHWIINHIKIYLINSPKRTLKTHPKTHAKRTLNVKIIVRSFARAFFKCLWGLNTNFWLKLEQLWRPFQKLFLRKKNIL